MACIITLIDSSKENIVKTTIIDGNYIDVERKVNNLNEALKKNSNKKELFWIVKSIGL